MEKIVDLKCKLQGLIRSIDKMIPKIENIKIMNKNDDIIDDVLN